MWQRTIARQRPKQSPLATAVQGSAQVSAYATHPARGNKAKGVRFGLPCERQCIEGVVVQKVVHDVVEDPTTCLFISIHIPVASTSNINLSNPP